MRNALVILAIVVAACGPESLAPLPFQVSISATPSTPARGASVTFVVTAQGGNLLGVEIAYGDGATETFGTSGARTATVTFHHAFLAAGAYPVEATVTDASAGVKTASVTVTVP